MKLHLHSKKRQNQRGIALLLVLAVIAILGIIIVGLWEVSEYSQDDRSKEKFKFQAKQLAESGGAIAMHPDVPPGDPVLRKDFGDGRSYSVRITTEGGRIRINSIHDEIIRATVLELFIRWGVDASAAAIATDSLADWIDTDSEPSPNGAEKVFYTSLEYPQYPLNRDFTSLEEMLLVRGMDQVARINPRWRDYFTLYSTQDSARSFEAARNGNDGIVGTEDDKVFQDEQEVKSSLGISDDDWNRVSSWVTLENTLRRIESTGTVGNYSYRLVILAEISGEGRNQEVTPVARISE